MAEILENRSDPLLESHSRKRRSPDSSPAEMQSTIVASLFSSLLAAAQFQEPFNAVVRRSMLCDEHSFKVSLEFNYPFYGLIHTEQSDPHCIYVDGLEEREPRRYFNFSVPMHACGTEINGNGQEKEYRNTLLVQRDRELIEKWDNSYSLLCKFHSEAREGGMASDRLRVLGPTEEIITKTVTTELSSDVDFTGQVLYGDGLTGREVKEIIQLGDSLTYVFRCDASRTAGTDCTIGECFAKDSVGVSSVQLSDANGCSYYPRFWSDFVAIPSDVGKVLTSSIWAWSFPADDQVIISCRLRLCPDKCDRTQSCSASTNRLEGPLKKTHDAVIPEKKEEDPHFEALSTFKIHKSSQSEPPILRIEKKAESSSILTECIGGPAFITLLTLLITTLTVMTSAICLLVWKLQRVTRARNSGTSIYG